MSRQMDDALKAVRSAALAESFTARPVTVFGYDLDRIQLAIEFFDQHAGIELHKVNLGGRALIISPDYRSAENALMAHCLNPKNPHLVIITPENKHQGYGWDRETPWTIISAPTHDARFWRMVQEFRGRYNNEPSDIRVAAARVGVF